MSSLPLSGKSLRLTRLSRPADGRYLFIPLDHSISDGPVASADRFGQLIGDIAAGGADGIIVHKGRARTIPPGALRDCSLIVHLSASTAQAPDADAKVLVGDVDDAIRLGADAVSVHVNVGSNTEPAQLADLGAVARACERWGMPLIAMMYPRGPRVSEPGDPALVVHAVTVAADLGADIVKTVLTSPPERMADVVDACPVPVVVAGGGGTGYGLTELAKTAMHAGCHGLAVGRRVFTSPDPLRAVRELAAVVHDRDRAGRRPLQPRMAGAL